ncbi:MAG: SBBP repeat-containing protein [Candidatus Sulfotelmatobacter sp.]
MGNGRAVLGKGWLGEGLQGGRLQGKISGRSWRPVRITGAALILVLLAGAMVGWGSRRSAQTARVQASAFPLSAISGKAALKAKQDARTLLGQLPLIFEPNQGQADSGVQFVSRGSGYGLYLNSTGAVLAMRTAGKSGTAPGVEAVRMTLVGANPKAVVAGNERLPGVSNYFIGNDPKKWHTGIPQFSGVRYQSVYPGIDLVFYGTQGHLEYDFKVAPGVDPAQAEMQFDGGKVELSGGDLVLKGSGADVRLLAPRIYQSAAGQRKAVDGRFVLRADNRVGFEIGVYDRSRELVIDPNITYSTYFGGSGNETYPSIAVNGDGFIYLAGSTTSSNLPVTSTAFQPALNPAAGAQNIFILKLDPTAGTAGILYLTYLGGSGIDSSVGLGVDTGGTAYVAGTTTSTDFPTSAGSFQSGAAASTGAPCFPNETGPCHVFVSALSGLDNLSAVPQLAYSTYLSGNGTDVASGLAIDTNGDVFVTGTTTSTNSGTGFPSTSSPPAYQLSSFGPIQFFVAEVNTRNNGPGSVPYSTYFGGSNGTTAVGGGVTVDTTGNIYFSGTTNFFNSGEQTQGGVGSQGGDFPILNAYQPCLNTPPPTLIVYPVTCTAGTGTVATDAFVAKLNPANAQTGASQLLFSTYFGGGGSDSSTGVTIDPTAAAIYITGSTNTPSTGTGSFVLPTGAGIFENCLNNANPVGSTAVCTSANATDTDAYVAKFTNPTEASGVASNSVGLSYFTYLGGSGNDSGLAIAVDTAGGALVTGSTMSPNFPVTTSAIQSVLNGTQNAFFAHIDTTTTIGQSSSTGSYATYFGGNGTDRGTSIAIDPALNTYFAGDTNSTSLQVQAPVQSLLNGTGAGPNTDAFAVKLQTANDLCIRCIPPVISPSSGVVSAGNQVTITFTVINQGPDLATNVTVTGQLTEGAATFNSATAGAGTCSVPTGDSVACTILTLQAGATTTIAMAVTPTIAGAGSILATVSNANDTNTSNTETASFTATSFSVSITPSSQTVVAGNTAQYSVLVAPSQTFGANVSLTCASLPSGASCGFSPTTLAFTGTGAQSAILNLTTSARPVTVITSLGWHGPLYALWMMVPGVALFGFSGSKRRRRVLGLFLLWMVFALVILLPACSKTKQQIPVTGTPAGSYPLQVTATSGTFTQSAGFSLTVQ